MQSWLKSLMGSGELTELPEEFAKLLAQAKRDRKALRELLKRSETASQEIGSLSGPLEALGATAESLKSQISGLQERTNSLGDTVSRFELLERREGELGKSQERLMETVERSSSAADRLEDRMGKIRSQVEDVSGAEKLITDLLGPKGPLATIRDQVKQAREESLGYGKDVAKLREDQAVVRAVQEGVAASYEDLRSKMEAVDAGVDKANASVARVDKAMVDLTKADELGARTERQLNALKTLSDHISGKMASVERQREAMDRTEAQARAVTDLHWELEVKLKEARSQIKEVRKAHSNVENLRELNIKVIERTDELRAEQGVVERDTKTLKAALAGLQEQMRRSTKRFELEQSTLEADGQRVIALRSDVTELENRFRELEQAGQLVNEASRKVEEMSARTTSLSSELDRLSEQVELVEGMREGMTEARRTAVEVSASLSRIEARQSGVQDAVNDLRALRGVQEEIAGAMESLRASHSEIERIQTGHSETGAWLAETHEAVRELRGKVAHLDDVTANVEHMHEVSDRVLAAASDLDERRESFEELEVRMSELRQTGALLDERTNVLLTGLADADNRFKAVARNADKADAARGAIDAVMVAVQQAERRIAELGEGVDSALERSEGLTLLSKGADRVMVDIRQRELALSKAAEQLEGVGTLRKEAAEVVQTLEDQIRILKESLLIAEEQSEKIGQRADVLEARAGSLRFAEKRITQFEEKLARLDAVEQELEQSMETLLARQDGVGQVRSDVEKLFVTSAKTLEDVRAIAAARDEVQSTAQMLESVRAKADAMTEALENIDVRHKQIEKAEVRLGRADALFREIRSSLESLTSQRAVVDQVIATSGKLSFETREAEGLIHALREEREMTQGIHDALKELREEDSDITQIKFGRTEG
jgi:chromosome segregation ATPase